LRGCTRQILAESQYGILRPKLSTELKQILLISPAAKCTSSCQSGFPV
jgi:hypothetical protein